jgi:hypothetical protein
MRHFAGWIVVRTILLADAVLVVACGFIALIWVAAPGGVIAAAVLWLAAGGLFGLLPLTDPYRAEERWRRKQVLRQAAAGERSQVCNHPPYWRDDRTPM